MAGKFINTEYFDAMDSVVKLNQDLLKNPFYLYNDKKGTKVEYYNINKEKSTLDPSSKLAYSQLGDDSPIRFNIVHDLYLYQFVRAELNWDNGEYGLETDGISGESYILPNTIVPCDGDFFTVDHIKDAKWLFQVDNVERDTLENGNNVYKIGWHLERTGVEDISLNIVEEYKYVDTVEGTNTKAVIKLERYDTAVQLENISETLIEYFKDLYYDEKVQTFIYTWYNNSNMYDPFSIEFMIRNKILYRAGSDYIHITHALPTHKTFSLEYDKTLFKAFEEQDKEMLAGSRYISQADYIDTNHLPTCIFNTRYEDYWALNYRHIPGMEANTPYNPKREIPILPDDFIDRILHNIKFDYSDHRGFLNIIIKYFNKEDLYKEDLDTITRIDYDNTMQMYYLIILTIFCIDYYCKICLR